MRRQRSYSTRAIVLKSREQGEADKVITVFTPQLGKRVLVARGVRKSASRKAGHLEPFTHVALYLAKARGWDIITQAETVTSFRPLRQDLDRMAYAFYFCELLDAFTQEEDSHPDLFSLLFSALEYLQTTDDLALTARWFELSLLRLSGYLPQFYQCVECGEALQPVSNYFSLEHGGVLCPAHGEGRKGAEPLAVGTLKVLRYLQIQSYSQISNLRLSPARMRQVQGVLAEHIRYVLERRLKSPYFIARLVPTRSKGNG
ncbi:MAG: DNA repair protein RecO [Chloroflexi bacterium]|nr:DNA repair protein RecO [Chloroflexota bacterium]